MKKIALTIWLLLNLTLGLFLSINLVGLARVNAQSEYTLTVNVEGNGMVNLNATGPFVYGDVVELTAVADPGWSFSGWSEDLSGSVNPESIIMDGNKTVTATFTQNEYTLTVSTVGSGSVVKSPDQATYHYGDSVTLNATAAEGWMFSGWSGDLSGSVNPESITMDGDKTVTATFTEIPPEEFDLTIAVTGSGSTSPAAGVHIYPDGTAVEVTATPNSGWMLNRWELDNVDVGSDNTYTVTMNANHSLIAVFTKIPPKKYELTVSVSGSGSTDPSEGVHIYIEDTEVNVTATPDTGWMLDHWILDSDDVGSANPYTVTMDNDHSLTAVFRDITPPTIEIISPQSTTYSTTGVDLTFTVNEDTSWIAYSLDGNNNVTISGNTTISGLSEVSHNIVVYATDTAGNTGESNVVYFSVDTTPPIIKLSSPDETIYWTTNVFLNFTINEEAPWIGYSLDGQNNVTITGDTVLSGLSEGSHSIVVFATDLVGNTGASSIVQFTIYIPIIDIRPPTIIITSPQEKIYSTSEVDLTFTINEPVSWRAYSLDGEDNVTIIGNTVLSGLSDGEHSIKVFARDNAGNTGVSKIVTFLVDTTPPIISLNSPEETTYSTTNVLLDFTLNEETTWIGYSLDEQDNVTITADLMLSGLSEGSHSIVVFATDLVGNTAASSTVQFAISIPPDDTTPPTVTINSPENTTYEASDVPLDFTVNEATSWIGYSLDGQDNVTITRNIVLSGLSEGAHNVILFATDSAGNTGASDLVQFAISIPPDDTTPPIIMVTSPQNTTYNTNKISLTFTVNEEPSLKSYSLDGKANVTVVDSIVLPDLSDGEHRLIMYAKDLTGNIGASKVIIFTIETENEEPSQLWIVGVVGIIACVGFMFSAYIAYDLFKSHSTGI